MGKNDIIEKIKKVLRMKNGATTAEFETALLLAKRLAEKHNIDLNEINPDEVRLPITHQEALKGLSRLQIEIKYAALIVHNFFNVNSLATQNYNKHNIVFIGTEVDVQIAIYTFKFLISRFRYEWNHNRGRLRNRQSFMKGMYQGLFVKLSAMNKKLKEAEGLVLFNNRSERDLYLQNNFDGVIKNQVKPDRESEAAKNRGYIAGLKTEINKGINAPRAERLALKS